MSLERICYLVNSSAKGGRSIKIWNQYFEPELKPRKKDVYFTEKEITEDLTKSLLDDYDIFVAAGGDGNLRDVTNAIAGTEKVLGILPLGSGNDFYRSLTGMNSSKNNYGRMIDIIKNRKISSVDICKVIYGDKERFYTNYLDFGISAEIVKNLSYGVKKIAGKIAYVVAFLKTFNYRPFEAELKFNSVSISQKCMLMNVSNIPSKASWFLFAPGAKINDGYLNVLLADIDILKGLFSLGKARKGNHIYQEGISYFSNNHKIKSLEIITEPRVHFAIDGDLAGKTPVKTEVYGKLKILS